MITHAYAYTIVLQNITFRAYHSLITTPRGTTLEISQFIHCVYIIFTH